MIGQVFGRLTVLREAKTRTGYDGWLCQCNCGKFITVCKSNLGSGRTKSCGCLSWKGEDASPRVIHKWLVRNKPKPEFCERCRERPAIELSYNNGDKKGYSRNPDDYEWLCRSCHSLKDQGSGAIMTKARMHRIREFYRVGAATMQVLADMFKVGRRTINDIIDYKGAYKEMEVSK